MTTLAMHKLQRLSGVMVNKDTPPDIVDIYNANARNSPLLRLPVELRVIIYEDVLSCVCFVWLIRRGQKVIATTHRAHLRSANIFQKLCKFTRAESRGLEFKVCNVSFVNDSLAHLMRTNDWRLEKLAKFTTSVSLQDVEGISLNADPRILHDMVFKFPEIHIEVFVSAWQCGAQGVSASAFITLGWIIEKVVRGKKRSFRGVKKAVRAWEKPGKEQNLTNLKFRPLYMFREGDFRNMIGNGKDSKFVLDFALKVYDSEENLIEAVRDWHEKGI